MFSHQNVCHDHHHGRDLAAVDQLIQAPPLMQIAVDQQVLPAAYDQFTHMIKQSGIIDSEIIQQACYPRPRLRWTPELHNQFVKAVDQLGGANKATPKAILNVMGVEGLTLYHLKSHLQKFRLGKTSRRLWRKACLPADYCCKEDESSPSISVEDQRSVHSNAFLGIGSKLESGIKALGAETCGNLHLLVDHQSQGAAIKNPGVAETIPSSTANQQATTAGTSTSASGAATATAKPVLMSLFPHIPTSGINYPSQNEEEWLINSFEGRRELAPGDAIPRPSVDHNAPPAAMDDYLNTSEFALITKVDDGPDELGRSSMRFGSFFDDVASFSKVEDGNGLISDNDSVAALTATDDPTATGVYDQR